MGKYLRYLWITSWYTLAIFFVFSAVTLSAARYLLPFAKDYNTEIEAKISTMLGQPVKINGLDAEWRGFGPKLVLNDVLLLNDKTGNAIARFDKAFLGFDILSFILHGQLGLRNISISGINLYIERHQDDTISIGGTLNTTSSNEPDSSNKFEQWILKQPRLKIKNTTIFWHDHKLKKKPVRFTDVNLTLKNDGERHRLNGDIKLPIKFGDHVKFVIDITGNPIHQDSNRNGRFYIKGKNIKPGQLLLPELPNDLKVSSFNTDFEIWSTWDKGKLTKVSSNISAKSIFLSNQKKVKDIFKINEISGKSIWRRMENGWSLDINSFTFNRDNHIWPESSIHLNTSTNTQGKSRNLEGNFDFLRIEDLVALTLLFSDLDENNKNILLNQNPAGDLQNVYFNINNDNPDDPSINFESSFKNLALLPNGPVPGIRGLSGSVVGDNKSGNIALLTNNATLMMPEIFREPIQLDSLSGLLTWEKNKTAWRASTNNISVTNEDISTNLNVKLDLPFNGDSPFLNLVASFNEGKAEHVSRYIPYRHLPKSTVEWLDKSFTNGTIVSGNAIFHGRLSDFPFDKEEGKFQVLAHAKNATIDYTDGWPPLQDLAVDMDFHNRGTKITASTGRIFASHLHDTVAEIRDMTAHPVILNISGKVTGPTEDKLEYLRIAPGLRKSFGDNLTEITMNGQSLLDLDLSIPLTSDIKYKTKINGTVTVDSNTINHKGALGTIWTNLSGELKFTEDNLSGKNITGLFFDYPSKLEIINRQFKNSTLTRFKTQSTVRPARIIESFIPSWSDKVTGETNWTVSLDIPHSSNKTSRNPKLRIKTSLEGVAINLPEPALKTPEQKSVLDVAIELLPQERKLDVQIGKSIHSTLLFNNINNKLSLNRGIINFNNNIGAQLPDSGIRIEGKNIQEFSYDNWRTLLGSTPEFVADKGETGTDLLETFSSLHVNNVTSLTAFNQTFHAVNIDAINLTNKWKANISSNELSGEIFLPHNFNFAPISMNLEKLLLSQEKEPMDNKDPSHADPRNWPAMIINSDRFAYDEIEFGSLKLVINKTRNGLSADKFELTDTTTLITGTGNWTFDGTKHLSQIELNNGSSNIGKTMTTMGFANSIQKGKGTFSLNINWADMPHKISAEKINGEANLYFKDGQLLDLSPGAGRVFGLLSFQSLPRRLLLDFSDVFAEGFKFDKIKGNFNIENGDAYTSDLRMTGPAAKIQVSGRAGFVDEDYDQLVTVIPDAAGSVPLLTLLAGAEPVTALMTWTLKNVFQSQIDKAVSFQYTITGKWDDPKIVKIKKPEPASLTDTEEDDEP